MDHIFGTVQCSSPWVNPDSHHQQVRPIWPHKIWYVETKLPKYVDHVQVMGIS